ncbi:FAD-dependent monooxygenase [Rathayibacter sp. AY1D2]|uniref:FAD binding domain-containing protein n=1 Tax=Rathayibacter sp. AY1D2 TaxID=2080543 RepID=UPI0021587A83|nr:FAD-dependent monooxygenase [Rathayibacter sp. AY1D2]
MRAAVAPEAPGNRYVGYSTWRGLIPESALPAQAAATLLGRFAFYTAPGEHMLGYLVPGPAGEVEPGRRRYNWVWYRPLSEDALRGVMTASGRPPESVSLAPGDLAHDLRRRLEEDALDRLPPPLAAAVLAEPQPFLQAIVDYVPPRTVRGRVALLGDAAVTVRPHTAMGAAKAAGDALALAGSLARHPVDEALERYEAERLPVGRAIAEYGRRLGRSIPLLSE